MGVGVRKTIRNSRCSSCAAEPSSWRWSAWADAAAARAGCGNRAAARRSPVMVADRSTGWVRVRICTGAARECSQRANPASRTSRSGPERRVKFTGLTAHTTAQPSRPRSTTPRSGPAASTRRAGTRAITGRPVARGPVVVRGAVPPSGGDPGRQPLPRLHPLGGVGRGGCGGVGSARPTTAGRPRHRRGARTPTPTRPAPNGAAETANTISAVGPVTVHTRYTATAVVVRMISWRAVRSPSSRSSRSTSAGICTGVVMTRVPSSRWSGLSGRRGRSPPRRCPGCRGRCRCPGRCRGRWCWGVCRAVPVSWAVGSCGSVGSVADGVAVPARGPAARPRGGRGRWRGGELGSGVAGEAVEGQRVLA